MKQNEHGQERESGVYYAPWEKSADRILTPFEHFIQRETASSLFLIAATILALILANSIFSALYYDITHMKLGFTLGAIKL